MSDPRYSAGVLQGIKANATPGTWPESLPGLGDFRGGQPLASCSRCLSSAHPTLRVTFVRYGEAPMCKVHALALARRMT